VIAVHLTETCEKGSPHLITHVETTSAPVSDDAQTAVIHQALKHKELLPDQHIVDTGYVDAKLLVESPQDYQIDLIGPTRANYRWQAREKTGFDTSQFRIDWQAEQAICPKGHTSSSWTPAIDNRKNEVIKIKFSTTDCQACPSLRLCTQSIRHVRRTVTIRPKEQYDALQARRQQETTQDWKHALCHSCRGRRDYFARGSHDGITSLTLHWATAHASPTFGDGRGHQCRSPHPVAGWRPSCQDQAITLCPTPSSGCLKAVTRVRQQYH
jgi:hypothetical protein